MGWGLCGQKDEALIQCTGKRARETRGSTGGWECVGKATAPAVSLDVHGWVSGCRWEGGVVADDT